MGIFNIFRKKPDLLDLETIKPFAEEVGRILESEIEAKVIFGVSGYSILNAVVFVVKSGTNFDFAHDLEPMSINTLQKEGNKIGIQNGSWFNNDLIGKLASHCNTGSILISSHKELPCIISASKGLILVSPVIKNR